MAGIDFTAFKSASPDQNATITEAYEILGFRQAAGLRIGKIVAMQVGTAMSDTELSEQQLAGQTGDLFLHYKYGDQDYEVVGLNRLFIKNAHGDPIAAARTLQASSPGGEWDYKQSQVAVGAVVRALKKSMPEY